MKGFKDPMDCESPVTAMEDEDGFVWFYECNECKAVYNSHGYNKLREDMSIDTLTQEEKISFLQVLVVLGLILACLLVYKVY